MESVKRFIRWLFEEKREYCQKCNVEMSCYGSHPWGDFHYECDECGFTNGKSLRKMLDEQESD